MIITHQTRDLLSKHNLTPKQFNELEQDRVIELLRIKMDELEEMYSAHLDSPFFAEYVKENFDMTRLLQQKILIDSKIF
jgi:hypothetical protein